MPPDISSLILDEVRALRATVDDLAADTKQRLATLEAHDHDVYGNGQPGRMSRAESRLAGLERWQSYVIGISVVITTVGGLLLKALLR